MSVSLARPFRKHAGSEPHMESGRLCRAVFASRVCTFGVFAGHGSLAARGLLLNGGDRPALTEHDHGENEHHHREVHEIVPRIQDGAIEDGLGRHHGVFIVGEQRGEQTRGSVDP